MVHLFYSKDAQGTAKVTAKSLLEACLRMKPDRIFLAEVRGDECFYFVRLAASGHPGSITSVHAGSCALAFEQMSLMIRESGAGGGLRMNEIKWLLSVVVDVVVQFDRDERGRFISEIFYEPRRQRLGRWDDAGGGGMSSVAALPFSAWPTGRKVAAGVFARRRLRRAGLRGGLPVRRAVPGAEQGGPASRRSSPASSTTGTCTPTTRSCARSCSSRSASRASACWSCCRPAWSPRHGQRRPLHGDARFASPAEVDARRPHGRATAQPGILIGRHRGRFLALPGQLSVMLSAPTRSGKGVGVVIPNLLNWPDSVVVLDIKGENYDITAGYRAAHGQAVYAFSPFDEDARSHRWNPLTAVRTSPLHRVGDLLTIGQVFFPNDGSGTSSEAFFNDQARNLFLGLGLVLLETPGCRAPSARCCASRPARASR